MSPRKRVACAIATTTSAAALAATLVSGCGAVSRMADYGVKNPLTPEQSKAQVVDAAKDIVGILKLPVVSAHFWRSSCNDQGGPPFQSEMRIAYPLAPTFEASQAQIGEFVARLRDAGWAPPGSDVHTHGAMLTKNGVSATFGPQAVGIDTNGIELLGECRDVTTTKQTVGTGEDVDLA